MTVLDKKTTAFEIKDNAGISKILYYLNGKLNEKLFSGTSIGEMVLLPPNVEKIFVENTFGHVAELDIKNVEEYEEYIDTTIPYDIEIMKPTHT